MQDFLFVRHFTYVLLQTFHTSLSHLFYIYSSAPFRRGGSFMPGEAVEHRAVAVAGLAAVHIFVVPLLQAKG